METAPPLDLDRDRVPRALLEGDDRSAVKAARPNSKSIPTQQEQAEEEEGVFRLTAAPPEDHGAAELQEPLRIEPRSVDRHGVLCRGDRVRLASRVRVCACTDSHRRHKDTHPVVDEGLPGVLQLLDEPVQQTERFI